MLNFQANTPDHLGNLNSPPLQRPPFSLKVAMESHDLGIISRQSTLSPLEKKDLLWTPQRSDTASTTDLLSHSKGTSITSNNECMTKFSSPQRAINNFSDEDLDEFSETASPKHGRKSISQKVTTSHLPKKSMGDIISRLEIRSLAEKPLLSKHNLIGEDKGMLSERFYQRSHTDFPACQEFHTGTFTDINDKSRFNGILPLRSQSFINDEYFGQKSAKMYVERNFGRARLILTDFEILENILRYCDFKDVLHLSKLLFDFRHNKLYQKIFNKRLSEAFIQGLDRREQIFYWNSILHFKSLKNNHPFAFSQHFAKKCAYLSDITKDLDRTLPEYERFSTEEGKASLLSVLVAVSNTIKDVGYIQGLNSIAGIFLFHLKEEESFWMMLYFMEKLNFKELLKEDFNRVHILDFQLQVYLDNYVPAIAEHFRKHQMNVSYFTTPWFLTLFSYHFNISNVIKIWNLLFTKGITYLIQLALSIFQKYTNEILAMDTDEVGCFLKNELQNLSEKETSLFSTALTFKVNNRLLAGLEANYEKGNYYLKLVEDHFGKKQWAVCQPIREGSPRRGAMRMRSRTDFSIKQEKGKDLFHSFINKFTMELPDTLKNIFKKKDETKREKNMAPSIIRSVTEKDEGMSNFENHRLNPVMYTLGDYMPSLNIIKPQPIVDARRKSRTHNDLTRTNSLFQSVQSDYACNKIQTKLATLGHERIDERAHRRLHTMTSLQDQIEGGNYHGSSNTLNSMNNYDGIYPRTDRGDYFGHKASQMTQKTYK